MSFLKIKVCCHLMIAEIMKGYIKNKMIELSSEYPSEIQEVFDSFKSQEESSKNRDIISFIRETKERKMFPNDYVPYK